MAGSARTVEEYCRAYLLSTRLSEKCKPPPAPSVWSDEPKSQDLRPGRPPDLTVTYDRPRALKQGALVRAEIRAEVLHKFWHHELQAAELFCWAILKFCDAPLAFRNGLLRIFSDEVRHMRLYQQHIASLGFSIGDFAVRDWFWDRVPSCETPLSFVALLGMGLEAANLEHAERFERWFRAAGDKQAAQIQQQVGREEVAHVKFATFWFRKWTGSVDFEQWKAQLPPPLSPLLMKGKTLDLRRRRAADFPEPFLTELAAYAPTINPPHKGSS